MPKTNIKDISRKMGFRDQKIENLLETPFTRICKWLKLAWFKFVIEWRVPQYTFATILFLNGIGLFWHVIGYWMDHYGDPKTTSGCFQNIIETQLPWNMAAFTFIAKLLFWVVIIAIPFVISVAIFIKKKK